MYNRLKVSTLKVLILGTFRRHPVPPEEIVNPVLERIGWDGTTVEIEEHYVDGREGLDFSSDEYLEDALRRVEEGLKSVDFADYSLVVCNFTGFNPSGLVLTAHVVSHQTKIAQTGWTKCPEFWAVHFDRERGYLPYALGPHNAFLREAGLTL